jgi:signal peptidase II
MPQCTKGLNKGWITVIISALVIIADIITKEIIVASVSLYERISVLPFLNIVHVQNKGAAFGVFAGLGNKYFIGIAIIAIIFIVVYIMKAPKGLETYALSLVLGGAIGNFIDRIKIGKVTDFIDIFVGGWHWPAFNVADSALTVGIGLFIISSFRAGSGVKVNKERNDI